MNNAIRAAPKEAVNELRPYSIVNGVRAFKAPNQCTVETEYVKPIQRQYKPRDRQRGKKVIESTRRRKVVFIQLSDFGDDLT